MIKQDYYATNKQGNCVNYGFKCFSCSHWHGYFDNGTCDMFKTSFITISSNMIKEDSMIKKDLEEVTANGLSVMKEMEIKITQLSEENEKLKRDRNEMFIRERDTENELRDVKYENEELKQEIKELEKDLNDALNQIEERSIDIQLLKEENELKADFRNFINEDIVRIKNENEQLKKEVKKFKCINKQLEERLDKDIALNMDCGDIE